MRRTLLVPLVAALLAVVSCDDSPTEVVPENGQYVALGDSYTSAPGVPTIVQEGCFRSDHNYPSLVAQELDLDLDDVSCGGAATTALIGVQSTSDGPAPAQFEALSDETDLVTIGIGGNDEGLFGALLATCVTLGQQQESGSPCQDLLSQGRADRIPQIIDLIRSRVTSSLVGIKERAPGAEVVYVGYPRLAPDRGRCRALPLTRGDYRFVRQLLLDLGDATRRAAQDADVHYVDMIAASAGHDVCAGPDAWIAGVNPDPDRPSAALHPYEEEQVAVADLVVAALDE